MSIENTQVIDAIGTEKDGSGVTLTVTDHLEWDDQEHLFKLQEKLNSYLAFIENGELYESYPEAKGEKIRISVVCKYHPDNRGIEFFEKCKKQIENAGYGFTFKIYGT